MVLAIFNPGKSRKLIIKAKVPSDNLEVLDESNKIIKSDIICSADIYYNTGKADCDLFFEADLISLEFKYYKVRHGTSTKSKQSNSYNLTNFESQIFKIGSNSELKVNFYISKLVIII